MVTRHPMTSESGEGAWFGKEATWQITGPEKQAIIMLIENWGRLS